MLTPSGELLEGASAAGRLLAGRSAREIPVVVSGASQGCMVTCWAMHKNCVGSCDFDRPDPAKRDPYGYNLKAALLMAPFGGGLGYRPPEDSLVEAARREEFNVQMMPSSEILAGVSRWPALFIGRGLWDFAESLEGSLACFRRARGPRMILAVRASHGEGEWGAAEYALHAGADDGVCDGGAFGARRRRLGRADEPARHRRRRAGDLGADGESAGLSYPQTGPRAPTTTIRAAAPGCAGRRGRSRAPG